MHDLPPVVDVVIPAFNHAAFLGEALRSVLTQRGARVAVVVVDDSSTDDSAAVAASFPEVTVLRQPQRGICAALNLGIRQGQAPWLAFLDSDDRWAPDKLARQLAAIQAQPELDLVFGMVRQFYHDLPASGSPRVPEVVAGIHRGSMLLRRATYDTLGPFSETPGEHDFLHWYALAREAGLRHLVLPEVVYERRIHANNLGRRTPELQRQSYLNSLRQVVARRHATGKQAP